MGTRSIGGTLLLLSVVLCGIPAGAASSREQRYSVEGSDVFRIGGREISSLIVYAGTETLTMSRAGATTALDARVEYSRIEGRATTRADGAFSATILSDGSQRDDANRDPDYLTVLNQPFSVLLDAATLRDLRGLTRSVPFDFPSPMTHGTLHGTLRRLPDGTLAGERVLGVAFAAGGPLKGTLSDRAMSLDGKISMNGTAYYSYAGALLLALDATLTIDGKLEGRADKAPVTIVYRRRIRPLGPSGTASRVLQTGKL